MTERSAPLPDLGESCRDWQERTNESDHSLDFDAASFDPIPILFGTCLDQIPKNIEAERPQHEQRKFIDGHDVTSGASSPFASRHSCADRNTTSRPHDVVGKRPVNGDEPSHLVFQGQKSKSNRPEQPGPEASRTKKWNERVDRNRGHRPLSPSIDFDDSDDEDFDDDDVDRLLANLEQQITGGKLPTALTAPPAHALQMPQHGGFVQRSQSDGDLLREQIKHDQQHHQQHGTLQQDRPKKRPSLGSTDGCMERMEKRPSLGGGSSVGAGSSVGPGSSVGACSAPCVMMGGMSIDVKCNNGSAMNHQNLSPSLLNRCGTMNLGNDQNASLRPWQPSYIATPQDAPPSYIFAPSALHYDVAGRNGSTATIDTKSSAQTKSLNSTAYCTEKSGTVPGLKDMSIISKSEPPPPPVKEGNFKLTTPKPTNPKPTNRKPTKPKRALSAYNFFFSHERARILGEPLTELSTDRDTPRRPHRKSHGKVSFKELARIIGERWKSANPETKAIYEEKAAGDLERYRKAMDEYSMAKTKMFASGVYDSLEDAKLPGKTNKAAKAQVASSTISELSEAMAMAKGQSANSQTSSNTNKAQGEPRPQYVETGAGDGGSHYSNFQGHGTTISAPVMMPNSQVMQTPSPFIPFPPVDMQHTSFPPANAGVTYFPSSGMNFSWKAP